MNDGAAVVGLLCVFSARGPLHSVPPIHVSFIPSTATEVLSNHCYDVMVLTPRPSAYVLSPPVLLCLKNSVSSRVSQEMRAMNPQQ